MVVKKVFIIVVSCLFFILIITFAKINITKIDNKNTIDMIKKIKQENKVIDKDIADIQNQISTLKEEKKDQWQELNAWQKAKEKLETALLP